MIENGDILIVNALSNELENYNKSMKLSLIKDYSGNPVRQGMKSLEGLSPIEWEIAKTPQLVTSNYTGNDHFFIWLKGKYCVSIINLKTFEVTDLADFWIYHLKNRKLKGLFVVGNQKCTKILGVASQVDESYILVYWEKDSKEKKFIQTKIFLQQSKQKKLIFQK